MFALLTRPCRLLEVGRGGHFERRPGRGATEGIVEGLPRPARLAKRRPNLPGGVLMFVADPDHG